jgi:hypothetical protein
MTRRSVALLSAALLLVGLVALAPSSSAGRPSDPDRFLQHVSSGVASRYYLAHPDKAPEAARPGYEALKAAVARARAAGVTSTPGKVPQRVGSLLRYTRDTDGLPQNEESVDVCRSDQRVVLGGTNDYRGLLDPAQNFTGWHFSDNGGARLTSEGLLPPVPIFGKPVASGGDPVDRIGEGCRLYAASLNYDPVDPFGKPNGIGLYRSTPATLASCGSGGTRPACWPNRRAVAGTPATHFFDKEWLDVGRSGSAGEVVWVSFTDFTNDANAPLGFTSARIRAVRCHSDLSDCTAPQLISGTDQDTQFSDVTIGPDGRTYLSWVQVEGELQGIPQVFTVKLRVAPAGSTQFGPTRVVHRETLAIPFDGHLHADGLRVATLPQSTVAMVHGRPRVLVTWAACRVRVLDTVCEEPQIKLAWSDNQGTTWSPIRVVSAGGDNYFPTISDSPVGDTLALAYYTSRFDPVFHNRQDVELLTVSAATGHVTKRQRVTPFSNEPEADPTFNDGRFVGDYFEVASVGKRALVHVNANYISIPYLHQGLPVAQQDNFLTRAGL